MGLERIGAVLQGVHDNYDTDLLRALIVASADAHRHADPDGAGRIHHRVIADHLRSTAFLIADGVLPSNEGRGYVLRRIMRRAMRHAHLLGAEEPVMYRLVPALVAQMGDAFPELPARAGADRGDAPAPRRPASRPPSSAACASSTTSSAACPTARRCPATPPSGSTTPSASRSTSPRTRSARSTAPSTSPASRPRWPSRRPRPAPPGPAPARPPTRRSGSTSPRRSAPPSSSATTPRPPRARCSPSCVGGHPVEPRRSAPRSRSSSTRRRSMPSPAARSATPARSGPTAAA